MKKIFFAASLLFLNATIQADVHRNTGCGLGSVLIEDQNSVVKQVFAATTNGTFGNQTFGITSGTLNCDKPVALVSNEKIEKFVADNMDTLAIDIAAGHGETLETLSSMMHVSDKTAFSQKLQANFSKIYTSAGVTSAQVIDSIVAVAG